MGDNSNVLAKNMPKKPNPALKKLYRLIETLGFLLLVLNNNRLLNSALEDRRPKWYERK